MSKELWIIKGRSPVLWTMPFSVTWEGQWAELDYAVPMLKRQREAVSERISLFAKRDPVKGVWMMKRADLETCGNITPGGDPELYYSWALPRKEQEVKNPDDESLNEFLDTLFMAGVGKSRAELEYYWNQFCRHILDTLLNKQKPVDLYFMKLHPTPYRENWKHVLTSRYPKLWRVAGPQAAQKRTLTLLNSGFMDELLSLDLLAYNPKEQYCYRRVEVEYGTYWWKNVRTIEKARMAKLGVWQYARNVTDCLKRGLESTVRIYGAYLAQIARPSVAAVEGESFGDYRFVPNIPDGRVQAIAPRVVPTGSVVPVKIPDFTPPRDDQTVSVENVPVSPLPLVQPPAKELWNGGNHLSQSDGRDNEAQGLHVLPPDEKLA